MCLDRCAPAIAVFHSRGEKPFSSFFYLGDYYGAPHASHLHQVMGITRSLGVEEKFYLQEAANSIMMDSMRTLIVWAVLAVLVLIALVCAFYLWRRRRRLQAAHHLEFRGGRCVLMRAPVKSAPRNFAPLSHAPKMPRPG